MLCVLARVRACACACAPMPQDTHQAYLSCRQPGGSLARKRLCLGICRREMEEEKVEEEEEATRQVVAHVPGLALMRRARMPDAHA